MGGTRTRRTPRKRHTHHPPGPRADRPADPAGTRDRCARRPGPHQKADRRTALPLPPHREHPPVQRVPQGRHQLTSSPTRHTRRAATRQRLNGMNIARVPGRDRVAQVQEKFDGARVPRIGVDVRPHRPGQLCDRGCPLRAVWFASERGSSAGRLRTVRGWAMDSSDRAPASRLLVVRSSHDRVRRVADVLWPVCRSDRECGRSADAVSRWVPLASFGPGHRVFEGNVRWISQGRPHHTPTPRP